MNHDAAAATSVQFVVGKKNDPRGSTRAEVRERAARYGGSAVIEAPFGVNQRVVRLKLDSSLRSGAYVLQVADSFESDVEGCDGYTVHRTGRIVVSDPADAGGTTDSTVGKDFPGGSSVRFRLPGSDGIEVDRRTWRLDPEYGGSRDRPQQADGRLTRINCALIVFQPDWTDELMLLRPERRIPGCRYEPAP